MGPEIIVGNFKQIRIFKDMFRQNSKLAENIRQRIMRAGQFDGQLVAVNAQTGEIIRGTVTPFSRAFNFRECTGIDTIGGGCY